MLPYSVDIVSLDQTGIVAGCRASSPARHRHRRGLDAQLCRRAHRRADVRRADDRAGAGQAAHRAAARGIHGLLRLTQSRCHSRAGEIMSATAVKPSAVKRRTEPAGRRSPTSSLPATGGGSVAAQGCARPQAGAVLLSARQHPGCTLEGQQFAALAPRFASAGITHRGHLARQLRRAREIPRQDGLSVSTAVGCRTRAVCGQFDVIREKNMYGRKFMGIERSTFLIDAEGVLRHEWRKVKVDGHALGRCSKRPRRCEGRHRAGCSCSTPTC